jgi:hypothetical protein
LLIASVLDLGDLAKEPAGRGNICAGSSGIYFCCKSGRRYKSLFLLLKFDIQLKNTYLLAEKALFMII